MTSTMTDDSKATLLLCGHFFAQKQDGPKPLAPREFNDVSKWLGRSSLRPGALFDAEVRSNFARETGIAASRIDALIGRGGGSRGIWVITRLDDSYPARLTERLGGSAPVILFGAGPRDLLREGGLAIVGSRNADEESLEFARSVARKCAEENMIVVSGAARGVDEEAMTSAIDGGGRALGVLADSLERAAMSKKYREPIESIFDLVAPHILKSLEKEKSDKEIAELLDLETKQARAWLQRLVADGRVRKLKKPVRYVAATPRLF